MLQLKCLFISEADFRYCVFGLCSKVLKKPLFFIFQLKSKSLAVLFIASKEKLQIHPFALKSLK